MKSPISRLFGLAALALATGSTAFWVSRGAHTGWTRTSVTTVEVDEFTGLEYPVETERFLPGIELLGAALAASVGLGLLGLWIGRRSS